jgi:hypothetical protein
MAETTATRVRNPAMVSSPRVIFARIGRMVYYAGPKDGDEKPRGGGGYNTKKLGHEVFNFADFSGHLFGFIQPARSKDRSINLRLIDPNLAPALQSLKNVLVVFVAPHQGGQRVIGWYSNATVHRTRVAFPSEVKKTISIRLAQAGLKDASFGRYTAEAFVTDAVLLPTRERRKLPPVPRSGGIGQSNVCYIYDRHGVRKRASWIGEVITFVDKYRKENLLKDPQAETISADSAIIAQERAAGFQSNTAIREAIEKHSMTKARKYLAGKGYSEFKNTAKYECYDYTCEKNDAIHFVEVKGTQTPGTSIILTRNEVKHITTDPSASVLVLVHSINVKGTNPIRVSGGNIIVRESWKLNERELVPMHYMWKVR